MCLSWYGKNDVAAVIYWRGLLADIIITHLVIICYLADY